MSIVLYSKYRRMKLRAAWELAGMIVWCKEVGSWLALFMVMVFAFQMWDVKAEEVEQAELAATKAARFESAWLSCMNHKGVWINGELYTCSLENTKFTRENWKWTPMTAD